MVHRAFRMSPRGVRAVSTAIYILLGLSSQRSVLNNGWGNRLSIESTFGLNWYTEEAGVKSFRTGRNEATSEETMMEPSLSETSSVHDYRFVICTRVRYV
jgi:hypothetical protein